jgi:predicted RNA-binding Zn-ribbon protein involved in translation (DUF1610 family)
VDCGSCLYVEREEEADIVCNECGAIVRTVRTEEAGHRHERPNHGDSGHSFLRRPLPPLRGIEQVSRIHFMEAFVCSECGEGVWRFDSRVQ